MVFRPDPDKAATAPDYPLETMRAFAVFLLVSYHVIGSGARAGLELSYPHPLRIYADFLIDLRMPLFAFIAGYVYGLRPAQRKIYTDFIRGKFNRLYVPGAISALVSIAIGCAGVPALTDVWHVLFFPLHTTGSCNRSW